MSERHPKSIRRIILQFCHGRYLENPLEPPTPAELIEEAGVSRGDLMANTFYLHDRGLAELALDCDPPFFTEIRITADGIDLVENEFEFNLRFPALPDALENSSADAPVLVERLVEQIECSGLNGEYRSQLLRDVQFLRDELARPADRWRREVIQTFLGWIAKYPHDTHEELPSLSQLEEVVIPLLEERSPEL